MLKTIRRVLLVLVLFAAALPWATRPAVVLAQEETSPSDTPAVDPAEAHAANPAGAFPAGLTVPTGGKIAIIEISGPILYQYHLESVQRRCDRAIADGADLIVFDFDTPGGVLTTAIDLSSYIRTLQVPTVAWVENQALSAGILIASACDEMVMSKASLAGDCAPIIPGRNLAPTERAKALSPLLAEFRANAQDNYAGATTSDYAAFHAMCVLGVEVYMVEHKLTGEVRLVSQADYAVMVDGESPIDAAKLGAATTNSALTNPDEFEEVAKPTVTVTNQSEMGQWKLVKQVHDGSTLLTINETEAKDLGLSRAVVPNEADLQKLYGASSATRYDETWSESLVGFLVHPVVRACLLLLGLVGIVLEYLSPGLIVPGVIGVAAIITVVGAPFLVGLAQTWHLAIIVIGVGLIIFELMTMTTFGVLAVVGLLMFLAGLVLSGVQTASNGLPAPGTGRTIVVTSLSFVSAVLVLIPVFIVMMKYFGSLPVFNKLVLGTGSSDEALAAMPRPPHTDEPLIAIGTVGIVSSTGLRPGGRIEVDEQVIDVTSTGGFVEPGTAVRVIEVHGNVVTVEPHEA